MFVRPSARPLDSSPITELVDGRHPDYQKRLQAFTLFVGSHRLLSGDIEPFLRIVLANVGVRSLRLANGTYDVRCSPDEPFAGPITKHRLAS